MNEDGEVVEGAIDIPEWPDGSTSVIFLRYTDKDDIEETDIFTSYDSFKECLPEPDKIFPFAADTEGNLFFFDYRKNEKEPAILFLDLEEAYTEKDIAEEDLKKRSLYELLDENFYRVANSFEEFLNMIYPDKE